MHFQLSHPERVSPLLTGSLRQIKEQLDNSQLYFPDFTYSDVFFGE